MISRKALNDLIIDYQTALAGIDHVARTLDDASIRAGSVSADFTRISNN